MKYRRFGFPNGSDVMVLAFDILSSSEIIEQLTMRGEVPRYFEVLTKLKHFIADEQERGLLVEPYKFTGDGWILLLGPETTGDVLLHFMQGLSNVFRAEIPRLFDILDIPPAVSGINFGVDRGPIFHGTIYGTKEYIARAIVVACRLQGAIKDIDKNPAYKALVTRGVFNDHLSRAHGLVVSDETPSLRNISRGAPFHCKKIDLLGTGHE
jgi:hypothetical protein